MSPASYSVDPLGGITETRWCSEEGQYIVTMIGSVYEFNQAELRSMGIELDDRF